MQTNMDTARPEYTKKVQAIIKLAKESLESQSAASFQNRIAGCLFFGVPNQGAAIAGTAEPILQFPSWLGFSNSRIVQDLKLKATCLADIESDFRRIRRENDIPVISCFELKPFYMGNVVSTQLI
jgi:hypothetical protein